MIAQATEVRSGQPRGRLRGVLTAGRTVGRSEGSGLKRAHKGIMDVLRDIGEIAEGVEIPRSEDGLHFLCPACFRGHRSEDLARQCAAADKVQHLKGGESERDEVQAAMGF